MPYPGLLYPESLPPRQATADLYLHTQTLKGRSGSGKGLFSFESQRKAIPKNVQTTAQLHSSHTRANAQNSPSQASTVYELNFQMFKLDLEKAEEPEIKLSTSNGSLKKQESSRKTSTSALLTTPKPLTVWIVTNCGKF